jgi:hypothetical protein
MKQTQLKYIVQKENDLKFTMENKIGWFKKIQTN